MITRENAITFIRREHTRFLPHNRIAVVCTTVILLLVEVALLVLNSANHIALGYPNDVTIMILVLEITVAVYIAVISAFLIIRVYFWMMSYILSGILQVSLAIAAIILIDSYPKLIDYSNILFISVIFCLAFYLIFKAIYLPILIRRRVYVKWPGQIFSRFIPAIIFALIMYINIDTEIQRLSDFGSSIPDISWWIVAICITCIITYLACGWLDIIKYYFINKFEVKEHEVKN